MFLITLNVFVVGSMWKMEMNTFRGPVHFSGAACDFQSEFFYESKNVFDSEKLTLTFFVNTGLKHRIEIKSNQRDGR